MRRSFLSLVLCASLTSAAEPVDYILSARWVVTMDAQRRLIDHGAVAVKGARIVAAGTRSEVDKQYTAKQRIDSPSGIITPGLINTHTHAPMSLMRGIADDLRLQDWLTKFIFPAEAKSVSPEFVRDGTRLACLEMLLSGTTTFTDMYYFEEAVAEAAKECGMRGVLGQTIIRFAAPDAKTPVEGLKRAEAFIQQYAKDPLIVPAVAPHALYTNDEATLRATRRLANRYHVPLLIHLSETMQENEDMERKYGVSPTLQLERWEMFEGRTLAAHAVWMKQSDLVILEARRVGVAHCPSSNMKLASGIAPVMQFLAQKLRVGLGTDGPAGSNNDLNLFEEMDLAAKLQKVHLMDPTVLPAAQVFEMATIRGAEALGMEKEIGSLEAGKLADLAFIRTDQPHAVPMFNIYSQLVYALKAADVQHVMVNGRLVVRDRKVLTLDPAAVLAKAAEWQGRIARSLVKQ